MVRVAINGFGRIGRMIVRAAQKDKRINIVAVNDTNNNKILAHLLKYDSTHGKFPEKVTFNQSSITVGKHKMLAFSEREPENLPWKKLKIDVVVEATGHFATKELASKHIKAGAKKVLISANYKGESQVCTIIKGVNDKELKKSEKIVSKGSCTTTCLSPIVKVLNDNLGITKGFMTTIHAVTNSERVVDAAHKDLREARSLLNNIIPTTTGAAVAVTRVIPELKGKIDGMAVRVPTLDGSLVDFTCSVKRKTSVEEVNKLIKKASKGEMKGVIEYSEEEIVSTDIIGNPHSSIFDAKLTKVNGNLVKVLAWYDNEYGYASRIVEMIKLISK